MQGSRNRVVVCRWDKGQTNSRVVDLNTNIPIIKLYARNLNIPVRRQRLSNCIIKSLIQHVQFMSDIL